MAYLIGKMIFCLLLASILGVIIGFFLKQFFVRKHYNEQLNRFDVERDTHNILDTNSEGSAKFLKSVETLPPDFSKLAEENVGLERKNNDLNKKIVTLRDQNKQIKQDGEKYQENLSRFAKEKKILEKAHRHLSKTNEADLCEMGCLKEQLVALTEDRDQIQAKISQLSVELSTEQQCTAELREKNRIMKAVVEPDDLKKIVGIGRANEQALKEQGVTRYAQIADFTAEDEKKYGNSLGVFSARITQEGWVEQAKILHEEKYGEDV